MRLEIDGLDAVMRAGPKAEQLLVGHVPSRIQRAVGAAVDNERRSHRYQNRTGDAEKSTRARATLSGATAEMGVPYAQVLNARGWSEFDVWMASADYEILQAIEELNSRL